ncbi:hypothetical protein [Jeotgalicoccus marinus]|uniref:hypothetical protein n=1 Tax=Jeotgalicoccus marinus TaxID=516700 RepID=UPI00047E4781|nr:hypothetical protein [Jeotgalicoccus marinus]
MLWLNLLMIVLVIVGLLIFAYGIFKASDVQVFFGELIVFTPIFWLTFDFNLLPLAPVFSLSVMYFLQSINSKKQVENNS